MTKTCPPPATDHREALRIQRILEQMERTVRRTETQYAHLRTHDRKAYSGQLLLFIPRSGQEQPPSTGTEDTLLAWAYNLSQSGVGLVAQEQLKTPEIWVGVHLPNNVTRWMYGRIVRCRPIPEEVFFDYGIQFIAHEKPPE